MHNKRNIIWNKSLNLHLKCRLKNFAASIKLICMSFCYQTILKCLEIFLLSSCLGIYLVNYQWCSRKNSIQTWQIFKSKASFLLKNLEMKILWMVLQMIETQTLTTFLFVDTDENGELRIICLNRIRILIYLENLVILNLFQFFRKPKIYSLF